MSDVRSPIVFAEPGPGVLFVRSFRNTVSEKAVEKNLKFIPSPSVSLLEVEHNEINRQEWRAGAKLVHGSSRPLVTSRVNDGHVT